VLLSRNFFFGVNNERDPMDWISEREACRKIESHVLPTY